MAGILALATRCDMRQCHQLGGVAHGTGKAGRKLTMTRCHRLQVKIAATTAALPPPIPSCQVLRKPFLPDLSTTPSFPTSDGGALPQTNHQSSSTLYGHGTPKGLVAHRRKSKCAAGCALTASQVKPVGVDTLKTQPVTPPQLLEPFLCTFRYRSARPQARQRWGTPRKLRVIQEAVFSSKSTPSPIPNAIFFSIMCERFGASSSTLPLVVHVLQVLLLLL